MGTAWLRVVCVLAMVGVAAVLPGCSKGSTPTLSTEELSQLPPEQQIIESAASGDVDTLKSLLAVDPSLVNIRGEADRTPLHFAAANGHNDAVRLLLENGADPFAEDEDGFPPQSAAQQWDHLDTAKIIAEAVGAAGEQVQ
ncbi:MAG: ankyrin repeat domain-containing protein [Candidatus Hydrogenedentes bacterium]|nr:ankyrin repeat domain-containing protein [Candidatus Hydrogenedentota bacterium]